MNQIILNTSTRLKTPESLIGFLQGMVSRLIVGAHRYKTGVIGGSGYDYIKRLKRCIKKYEEQGNLEFLIDAANYCWLEYQCPRHESPHFTAMESSGRNQDERFAE